MKIVHITIDEKFINSAVSQFDALPGCDNTFYILSSKDVGELKYVEAHSCVQTLDPSRSNLRGFARSISNATIVFHGFTFNCALIVNTLKNSQNNSLVWIGWGAEFYANSRLFKKKNAFLKEKTTWLEQSRHSKSILNFKSAITRTGRFFKDEFIKKALSKMDFIGVSYDEQKIELNSKFNKEFKYFSFMYYPIEKMVTSLDDSISGNNILLGNSASATNNHLEILSLFKNTELLNRKVYCPLSYGNDGYRDKVIFHGSEIIPNNFFPLIDFMPLKEYNDLIKSCGVVIMNHKRQQAFGNIITMVYYGAKIFLDEQNSIYQYLKRIGVYVYSIQDDLENSKNPSLDNLTITEQKSNREIILNEVNSKTLFEKLKVSFSEIEAFNGY